MIWKTIYTDYEINEDAAIRRKSDGRGCKKSYFLSSYLKDGHPQVSLYANGKRKIVKVHTLMLNAFVGPRPNGKQCAHFDGNLKNNKLNNLSWANNGLQNRL